MKALTNKLNLWRKHRLHSVKYQQLLFTFLFSLLTLLVSCSTNDLGDGSQMPGGGGDIEFAIGFAPQTRVSTAPDFTSTWEDGDEIGLFAVAHGNPLATSGNYIHNVKLTYNSANGGSWSGPAYWPTSASNITSLDFYAYYPYDIDANDPTAIAFNVKTDQSLATNIGGTDRSNYNLSDLLTAKSDNSGSGWNKDDGTVSLTFKHALAMVQLSLPSPGKGFGPSSKMKVTLRAIKPGVTLNLGTVNGTTPGSGVTLVTDNEAVNISMYRLEQPTDANYETTYTYRALVPAQTVTQGVSLFWFEHEARKLLTDGPLASALTMTAGKAETFIRTLPATLIHTELVPAGTFLMGSPTTEPSHQIDEIQHQVILTEDFYMSKYPVTFAQYDAFCDATSQTEPTDGGWGRGDLPVINVSWNDAVAYCVWLSEQTGLTWTLPTEAQWEYACRGGQTESLPFGIGDGTMLYAEMANFSGNYPYDLEYDGERNNYNGSDGHSNTILGRTTPVGSYIPNDYGLYDMHGNVYEWCSDWYDANYGISDLTQPVTNPIGPDMGDERVLRGSYWGDLAKTCRSAYRNRTSPSTAGSIIGFRVVFVP